MGLRSQAGAELGRSAAGSAVIGRPRIVLAPALLVFLGALLIIRWRPPGVPGWETWLGAGPQLAVALGTGLWWGPIMAGLERPGGGLSPERYSLLLSTHWLRVAIVTAYGLLSLLMLGQRWKAGQAHPAVLSRSDSGLPQRHQMTPRNPPSAWKPGNT